MKRFTRMILAGLTFTLALIHIVAGGQDCAQPLLDSTMDETAKLTVYACWHFVSTWLVSSGVLLLWSGSAQPSPATMTLSRLVIASFVASSAVFIAVVLIYAGPGGWLRLPQGIAFAVLAVPGVWATSSAD